MALEDKTAEELAAMELQVLAIANRFRDLRLQLAESGETKVTANFGTFRHSLSRADKFSAAIVERVQRKAE